MSPETYEEIAELLHRARQLIPAPLFSLPREEFELHRRLLALETETRNAAAALRRKDGT